MRLAHGGARIDPGVPCAAPSACSAWPARTGSHDPCPLAAAAFPWGHTTPAARTPPTHGPWQYDLTLLDRTHYRLNGHAPAAYRYDAQAKTLRFTSGELKGFVGLYFTTGQEANGPTIALDAEGGVPDPEHAARGRYQYATLKHGDDR